MRLGADLPAELEEFVGAEAVVVGVAAPNGVGVIFAVDGGADAVFPLVDRGEGAAGPADKGGMRSPMASTKVGAEFAGAAGVGGHEGDEIDEGGAGTRWRGFRVEHWGSVAGTSNLKGTSCQPLRLVGRRDAGEDFAGGVFDLQGEFAGSPVRD